MFCFHFLPLPSLCHAASLRCDSRFYLISRLVAKGDQQFIRNHQEHNRSWKVWIDVMRLCYEMCHALQCYVQFLYALVCCRMLSYAIVCSRYLRSFRAATAAVTVIGKYFRACAHHDWRGKGLHVIIIARMVQEHQFRGAQDVVRHHAEIDLETRIRVSECFHD